MTPWSLKKKTVTQKSYNKIIYTLNRKKRILQHTNARDLHIYQKRKLQ